MVASGSVSTSTCWLAILSVMWLSPVAELRAQVPDLPLVSQGEVRSQLTAVSEPRLPLLAGASGINGPVHVEVDVAADGRATAVRLLHGSPLLQEAATAAVQTWRFPVRARSGAPMAYRTSMLVTFAGRALTADDAVALGVFGDATLVCADAARRQAFRTAEQRCRLAGMVADRLTELDRLLPSRPKRILGESLIELGRHAEAVRVLEWVESRLRQIPFFSLDRTLALRGLGRAHGALGQHDAALRAYGQAERQLSEAHSTAPRDAPFRVEVAVYLREMATDYLRLLDEAGRTVDAARLRARVAALP